MAMVYFVRRVALNRRVVNHHQEVNLTEAAPRATDPRSKDARDRMIHPRKRYLRGPRVPRALRSTSKCVLETACFTY